MVSPAASAAAVPRGTPAGGLAFPEMPRLGLDELLAQLVDRAGDVLAAQGRLPPPAGRPSVSATSATQTMSPALERGTYEMSPPSTRRICPVIDAAPGAQRKRKAETTSSSSIAWFRRVREATAVRRRVASVMAGCSS